MLGGTYSSLELEVSLIYTKLPKNTMEHSSSFFWFCCFPVFSCRIFYGLSRIFLLSLDFLCYVPEYSIAFRDFSRIFCDLSALIESYLSWSGL